MGWLVSALQNNGVEVKKHPDFLCRGLDKIPFYDWKVDKSVDICIYNHADLSHLVGANSLKSKKNWFFKSTVPDEFHTTLDEVGYGPYSSITYDKPNFENVSNKEVNNFFATKVKNWINKENTKWGKWYSFQKENIKFSDYFLVLGQCFGDEVVTRHEFGNYYSKLTIIVKELSRISNKKIVIKLHPMMDGVNAKNFDFSLKIKSQLEKISNKVIVYTGFSNVHNFIKNAYCVLLANSGAGFEVMMHQKPMITWGFPEYHWVTKDLRHLADLNNAIKLDWFNKEKSNKFLFWYLEKYCYFNQETANRRVEELLLDIK